MPTDVLTELLSASSGSVGDVVHSRNQHGPYIRARTAPFDPGSAAQLAVRAALSQCVTAWNSTLSQAERDSWDVYALASPVTGPLGRTTNAGGLAMFVRSNVPRIQASVGAIPRVDQAPTLFCSPPVTPITEIVLNFRDDTLHPFFNEADPWVTQTDAALLVYASAPQTLDTNFWKGPYRYAGKVLGDLHAPPTSPATIPLPVPATGFDHVFFRGRVTLADARLTESFRRLTYWTTQARPVPILATWLGGAPPRVDVQFDQLLRVEPHDLTVWRVRHGNLDYRILTAVTNRDVIEFTLLNLGFFPHIDAVSYIPPPADLHGLLNGVLARGFRDFPLT